MKLKINGQPRDIDAESVADALAVEGLAEARVATALNGNFVPASMRTTTLLSPGDALEVVAPMQGG
ncbi:sulfur carrier protein ThiS [uncultured Paracoccus sp.]|jgi:sulfur carrier protein|uniref:sulfur carrier protein ThiS n=1 Tax=uncultured Paracoccus sp. TaxID=189685 RepID=UPI00261928AA|nr:sulfur carrier protein ThiS [uncultured Paracoccus sp.]